MILGILMSDEVKIAVLETQVERLLEKQKELTERVRANEKVVAAIGLFGSVAVAFIGAGYFAPKAEAFPTAGEMVQKMREHQSEQNRTPAEESINRSLEDLWEEEDGSNDPTVKEELLQLPSDKDSESIGRGYDRCSDRSWIRFIQERTGKNCRSRHS
jgi:hypothetical protein